MREIIWIHMDIRLRKFSSELFTAQTIRTKTVFLLFDSVLVETVFRYSVCNICFGEWNFSSQQQCNVIISDVKSMKIYLLQSYIAASFFSCHDVIAFLKSPQAHRVDRLHKYFLLKGRNRYFNNESIEKMDISIAC